ncbi:MAG: DUF4062 domain-containing protein [Treponema sp.]|jgi:hypothetical protein|nr:DUF4062 domain-containing protein [Treponema sp.]
MKYHIFVGSTLDDLKNERRELFRIIMEFGHIPVTAEYIDPQVKDSCRLLQKTVEECDYFIALSAYRYCPETEYAIAVKKGIPVIALIIDEKARWKASKKEADAALIKNLEEYKQKLRGGAHETWLSTADLCQKAQSALIREMNLNPRDGWVRGEQAVKPLMANELARLSGENDILRRQIKIGSGEMVARLREQMKKALKMLALNKVSLSFYYAPGDNWENTRQFRCLRIFKLLTPELALGKTTSEVSRFLGTVLNPDLEKTVRKDYPTPSNTIKKIMADFELLRLVKCANGGNDAGDEIWEITEYGKELYSAYRMRQLEKALKR